MIKWILLFSIFSLILVSCASDILELSNTGFDEEVSYDFRENPARGMPPDRIIYPGILQDDLNETQLELITCWIQNNFPE